MTGKHYKSVSSFFAVILVLTIVSCDPAKKYEKAEDEEIQKYILRNGNLSFELQPSGLYYYEVLKGTGVTPVLGDSAFVKYTLMLLDGTTLYSNVTDPKPYAFIVGSNISGFDEGIMLMAVGGKATLLIPSKLAYGSLGKYPIGGYTPLLFDVELLQVKGSPGK